MLSQHSQPVVERFTQGSALEREEGAPLPPPNSLSIATRASSSASELAPAESAGAGSTEVAAGHAKLVEGSAPGGGPGAGEMPLQQGSKSKEDLALAVVPNEDLALTRRHIAQVSELIHNNY
jgi:hypothetical protein